MIKIILNYLMSQRTKAYNKNLQNILHLLKENKDAKILDLGCDDGQWTKKLAEKVQTNKIFGVEIVKNRAQKAKNLGVKVALSDLNNKLPYKNESFDIIHANQVIEHINDTDTFTSEIYRILKPGGYAIISTENLASWHNIVALIFGFMPFSLTNTTSKTGALGNPLAPHNKEEFVKENTWQHQKVFTTKGLKHLFSLFKFKVLKIKSAGYYPFGNLLAKLDKTHAAFITFKIKKQKKF